MTQSLISVAMATFNGEKYILEQLESIARQTLLPGECVICDDGSTDATIELINNFKKKAPFEVRLYKNNNRLGLIKNFEKALGLCKGDIVFLSDQDDVWIPEKINIIKSKFINTDAKLIIHDCVPTDSNLNRMNVGSLYDNTYIISGRDNEYILGCCTAVRRELLDICLPFPELAQELQGHDGFLHYIAGVTKSRFVNKSKLIFYRRHGANTSGSQASGTSYKLIDRLLTQLNYLVENRQAGIDKRLEAEIKGLTTVHDRILARVDTDFSNDFIERIRSRKKVVQERIKIRITPKLWRPAKSFSFLMKNGYSNFSGFKSLVIDLVR